MENQKSSVQVGEMRKRRITLADGRYLIFFTFGDETGAPFVGDGATAARRAPEAEPSAEEERSV